MENKNNSVQKSTLVGNFYNDKKLKKNAKTIFAVNVAIFTVLCVAVFIIVFLPLIL